MRFVSYQEAQGKPEQPLPDDQPVLRDSILNFSVNLGTLLQQQQQHTSLLKGLYRDRVSTVISKYSARFLEREVADVDPKAGLERYFDADKEKASAAAAALVAVGLPMSSQEFASRLDATFTDRNSEWLSATYPVLGQSVGQTNCDVELMHAMKWLLERACSFAGTQHVNTIQQLEKEMKQLLNDGAVHLLKNDMQLECTIIEHHEVFLSLLEVGLGGFRVA